MAVYASAIGCVFLLSYLFVTGGSKKTVNQEDKKVVREVFTPQRLNDRFGIPGLAHDLEEANRKIDDLTKKYAKAQEIKEARQEQDNTKFQAQVKQEVERQVQEIRKDEQKNGQKNNEAKAHPPGPPGQAQHASSPQGPLGRFEKPPDWVPAQARKETTKTAAPGSPLTGSHTAKDIRVITAESSAREAAGSGGQPGDIKVVRGARKSGSNDEKGTFIPSGSIFSGTLLTGMDAPCGPAAKRDPFPVLLRVKRIAILPNRYTADVRECFLVASGYGDQSSERAYFRSERFSCIREDGKALENRVEMFATGEDGKAGIRGRLVSKQGAIIGRALLAGFMEGFSKIFGKTPVLSIDTGQNGFQRATPFQRNLSKDSMEAAGVAGMGNALDNLAHYYMKMAEDLVPVVEIDAGREVDFILISGVTLKLKGN
ncbi:MAG: TraB/TrbI/VirB10 family type IV secretion system protein [Desulfobaccales bacterium]